MPRDLPAVLARELERPIDQDGYGDAVQRLLHIVRTQLGMDLAYVSRFVGSEQVLDFVDAAPWVTAPPAGTRLPLSGSYCARVVDGRLPELIVDARSDATTALLDITARFSIGAYLGVPLRGPGGHTTGTLCAVNAKASPGLSEKDVQLMRLLADVLADLAARAAAVHDQHAAEQQLRTSVLDVIDGQGRAVVLQPVFDLDSGHAVAAEALTRFSAPSPLTDEPRSASQWFEDAESLGLRPELELATAASALARLDSLPPEVAITLNLQPETIRADVLEELLEGVDPHRVVIEVTEHAVVVDYDRLLRELADARAAGLRLAVDDTGAGFASLRHVLLIRPDLIKIDMALVRDCDTDPVRLTLLKALREFAGSLDAGVVAEGVETEAELDAIRGVGVEMGQGFGLARPSAEPAWELA